ncbi:MAG: hypothetical protein AAGU23_00540 [Bacillota bacterium]
MLLHRKFERNGDQIKMISTYDHSEIYRQNLADRMTGDKGYIDQGKDLMRVARIPIETLAAMSEDERHELLNSPQGLVKFLQKNPQCKASAANL